ncbi:hypothetical protein D3C76_1352520 [compost metagenome]
MLRSSGSMPRVFWRLIRMFGIHVQPAAIFGLPHFASLAFFPSAFPVVGCAAAAGSGGIVPWGRAGILIAVIAASDKRILSARLDTQKLENNGS